MRKTSIFLLFILCVLNTGCMSMMSLDKNREEMIAERVYTSGDEQMMNDFSARGSIGVSIKVTDLDALMQNPLRTLGAAVADAGIGYGIFKLAESLLANIVYVKGNYNTVNMGK